MVTMDSPSVLAIGGLSECGKSTVGKYLVSKGLPRLKIVTFLRSAFEISGIRKSFEEWAYPINEADRVGVMEQFTRALMTHLNENEIRLASLESLYDPLMTKVLKESLGPATRIVYIDMPDEMRMWRQAGRLGIDDLDTARAYMEPRDADKIAWGALEIKAMADVVIDNSQSVEELYLQVDELLAQLPR